MPCDLLLLDDFLLKVEPKGEERELEEEEEAGMSPWDPLMVACGGEASDVLLLLLLLALAAAVLPFAILVALTCL